MALEEIFPTLISGATVVLQSGTTELSFSELLQRFAEMSATNTNWTIRQTGPGNRRS